MAKLGTTKKPIIVQVQTEEKAQHIAQQCAEHGWHFTAAVKPDDPEDIADFEKALNPPTPIRSEKVGRNDSCPCGSEKKYKKCCGDVNNVSST